MIGLIFGETDFPKQTLKKIKNTKKYLIIDLTQQKIYKKNKNTYPVSIGQFGKIIKILKSNKCSKVLFAGKVKKPNFSKLKLDLKSVYYIPSLISSSKLVIFSHRMPHTKKGKNRNRELLQNLLQNVILKKEIIQNSNQTIRTKKTLIKLSK